MFFSNSTYEDWAVVRTPKPGWSRKSWIKRDRWWVVFASRRWFQREVTVFQSLSSGHMVTISNKVMLRIAMSLLILIWCNNNDIILCVEKTIRFMPDLSSLSSQWSPSQLEWHYMSKEKVELNSHPKTRKSFEIRLGTQQKSPCV